MIESCRFKHSLGSDNHSGVHPAVMQALIDANRGHAHAYGLDELSELTRTEFRRVFGDTVDPQYVFTGTAANVLCLQPLLKSFEAVICSSEAHIHVDECGAPEHHLGAKLYTLPTSDGRIRPEDCVAYLERGGDQHYAQPRVISLTQPTEFGVCYTLDELRAWREFATRRNLMLHIDGARLVNAAAFLGCDLKAMTADIGADVVSFGGTKNGLMGAEACLLFSDQAKRDFKFYRKQAMQLSSKTRFLSAQFYAYLKNDLWRETALRVTGQARRLASALQDFPEIRLAHPVESNAIFVHLPKAWIAPLKKRFFFYTWPGPDSLCRLMISFDWTDELSGEFISAIREVRTCSLNA